MEERIVGIDVGGTTIKCGWFDSAGKLLEKWEIPTRTEQEESVTTHKILTDVAQTIQEKEKETGIAKEQILGIGMGIPGPVLDDGTILKTSNLGWGVFNAAKELQEKTGIANIRLSNDANIAALGEMHQGAGKGYENLMMITLGTGVGGGLVIGGRVVNGANGAAGEIGHIKVNEAEEDLCGCGRRGCLEQYAASSGMLRIARKELKKGTPSVLSSLPELTTKDIFQGAKEGDSLCEKIVEGFGNALGLACAQIATIVNPQVFLLGGGIAKAGPQLIPLIRKNFTNRVMMALENTEFKLAELGNDAGIYGAAGLIRQA